MFLAQKAMVSQAIILPPTTLNPLDKGTYVSLSDGNLKASANTNGTWGTVRGTNSKSTGKWYFEVYSVDYVAGCAVGIANATKDMGDSPVNGTNSYQYTADGYIVNTVNTLVTIVASYTAGQRIGIAYDASAGVVSFYKNNELLHTSSGSTPGTPGYPMISVKNSGYATSFVVCFSAGSLGYSPPYGYSAWG